MGDLTTHELQADASRRGLKDGRHELSAKVVDAAGNAATVLDQTITTSNPLVTPRPTKGVRVRVSCAGHGCPRMWTKSATGRHMKRLLSSLRGRSFRAGDRLQLTVTAPKLKGEKVQVTIRNNRIPKARLLH